MEPTQNKNAGTVNPLTGRTRTGGTFDTATGGAMPQASTSIPVSAIETTAPAPLQMPDIKPLNIDASAGIAQADTLNQRVLQQAELRKQQQTQQISDTERKLMRTFGLLSQEGEERADLEMVQLAPRQERIDQLYNEIYRQRLELAEFDKNAGLRMSQLEIDASKRDITKRTFASMSREEMVKIGLEKAEKTASLYANLATADMFERNYQRAAENIDRAIRSKYEPIREQMKMEMFFLQRLDARLEGTQKELAEAKRNEIQREFAQIDRAIVAVDAAVASGYASAEDIQKMTSLSGNPEAQRAYAQSIVAKGAIQTRLLDEAAKRASIANSALNQRKSLMELALAGDPKAISQLDFDPGEPMRIEQTAKEKIATNKELERLDNVLVDISNILGNKVGLTTSSGQFRSATISGFIGGQIMNQQENRSLLGKTIGMMPVVGNVVNAISANNSKDDFLAQANRLLTEKGFEALIGINERVKLTPITEMEVNLAFASANALNSAAIRDEKNKLLGFKLPEDKVQAEFAKMYTATMNVQAEIAAISELGYAGYLQLIEMQRQLQ